MKATKQTTYSWESGTNVSEEETREFANYLLCLIGEKQSKSNLKFEIAPKSTEIQANWDTAMDYGQSLNIHGKTGWRLPSKEELNEIYESDNDFEEEWYWSSTAASTTGRCGQNFGNGNRGGVNKNDGSNYVRAIRDI